MSIQFTSDDPRRGEEAQGSIIVGTDGSEGSHAAVTWASDEAISTHRSLLLASAYMPILALSSAAASHSRDEDVEQETRSGVEAIRARLATAIDVRTHVVLGQSSRVLLDLAADAELLVVGQRGIGRVERLLWGSTSIAVAGRSPIPTVIVPDRWKYQASMTASTIVVGVDLGQVDDPRWPHPDAAVLAFAFTRAARLGVPLVAIHAMDSSSMGTSSTVDMSKWVEYQTALLTAELEPWVERFPAVDLDRRPMETDPVPALIEASQSAQMVVLGRHTKPFRRGGFSVGSTTRATLHHANCPVAVVPIQARSVNSS